MAIGKMQVLLQNSHKKQSTKKSNSPKSEEILNVKPASYMKGSQHMDIVLLAPTKEEAEDFLCGLYFDLMQCFAGKGVSVYTNEFATITKLAEVKQDLEASIMKTPGSRVYRAISQDEENLTKCTFTLSQSANQSLSLDLNFKCVTSLENGCETADFVLVLVNSQENGEFNQKILNNMSDFTTKSPVFLAVCGFENEAVYWEADGPIPFKAELRHRLTEKIGISAKENEWISFVQLYGGLEFAERDEQGLPLFKVSQRCRDYMPFACHIPIIAGIFEVWNGRKNSEQGLEPAAQTLYSMLSGSFAYWAQVQDTWCVKAKDKEAKQ